jgi:methyltransferase (TIGR00027 family)
VKADRPSRTAKFVVLGRAVADAGLSHVLNFHDPIARSFLSDKGKQTLAKVERAWRAPKPSSRVEGARVMADLMALRTSAIDTAVAHAFEHGATQFVLLGAGYDSRAWRMPELAGARVFEVDHPATQKDKRARAAEVSPPIGTVTFVPIDFERETLGAVLGRAGHDASAPTCWVWEGVVMYLTRDAMRATLAGVAARSAPGSTLIVNYHTGRRTWLQHLIYRLIGEPQISSWTPEEMAADLRTARFVAEDDSGMRDWNTRFAGGMAKVERASYMRIVVAVKK